MLLVSAPAMANRQMTIIVATVGPGLPIEQRLVRLVGGDLLLVINNGLEPE